MNLLIVKAFATCAAAAVGIFAIGKDDVIIVPAGNNCAVSFFGCFACNQVGAYVVSADEEITYGSCG